MQPNNVHIAYLRRIKETLSMRSRRQQLMKGIRIKDWTPVELERMRNKNRALLIWEQSHAAVL